jgi:energy-converting hydrogenase A subunit M
MSSLRTSLESLAASFASDLVRAIQASSLEELRSEVAGSARRGRPAATAAASGAVKRGRPAKAGRLHRRSPEDIAAALDKIVGMLKKHNGGLRAEQIREALHMQAKEMPRVLAEGLGKRKLKKKGQKRATTYIAS